MKKLLLILIGGLLMFNLFGCKKKYTMTYDNIDLYQGAKSSYHAKEKVEIYYNMIASDTDYTFYLNDEFLPVSYSDSHGFILSFTMPDHDSKISHRKVNSMTNIVEPEVIYTLTYGKSIFTADGTENQEIKIEVYNNDDTIITSCPDTDSNECERYRVDYRVFSKCEEMFDEYKIGQWNDLKNYECLDGVTTYVRLQKYDDVQVGSTNRMPSGGQRMLGEIGNYLFSQMSEENKIND